jgi:uncharacterized membrane protein YdjX (TVP38/TMEM64 family)
MRRIHWLQLGATATVLVAVAVAALVLSPAGVLGAISELGNRPVLFGSALLVLYLVRPVVAWPVSPISALVGYVLGVWVGVPVALAGAVLTCIPPFLLARYVGSPESAGPVGWLCETGQQVVGVTGATRGVLAARLSPVPADPVSYGAGFSDVSPRAFLVGTAVGEIPWVVLEVLAGASMHHLTMDGLSAGVHLLVLSAVVSVLVLAGPAYRHVIDDTAG